MRKVSVLTVLLLVIFVSVSYAQTITVTSPRSGDTWYKGSSYTITWTHTGEMNEYVKIRLYQGSTKILGIEDSTDNDGSYSWTVPADLPAGTYYIRVKTVDNQVYDDGDTFTIADAPSASINVWKPSSTSKWYPDSEYDILWRKTGNMNAYVKIRLYKGDTKILPITDRTENNGYYRWKTPKDLEPGKYYVRVKTIDNLVHGNSEEFSIMGPAIFVHFPHYAVTFLKGKTYKLKWSPKGNMASTVKISLKRSSTGATYNIVSNTENDGEYEWTVPSTMEDGGYNLKIETTDGNVRGSSSLFLIKSLKPFLHVTFNNSHCAREKLIWKIGRFVFVEWYSELESTSEAFVYLVSSFGTSRLLKKFPNKNGYNSYSFKLNKYYNGSKVRPGDYYVKIEDKRNNLSDKTSCLLKIEYDNALRKRIER